MFDIDDPHWIMALAIEANDARALFSHGLHTVRNMGDDYNHAVAAMSLLALGAEKLLKLTIGLVHVERHQSWPEFDYMQRTIGHRVAKGDREARSLINLYPGTVPGWIAELGAAVDADPVLPSVLEALDRFGSKGRFYFLDALGNKPQPEAAPQTLWVAMTKEILAADPATVAGLTTFEGVVPARLALNGVIVRALTGWWDFYRAVWTTGVIGERAKQFMADIKLLDHTLNP